jgi:hypothetical protein
MRRTVPFVTVILSVAVAAAGCTSSPRRVSGPAAPAGASASSGASVSTAAPAPSPSRSEVPLPSVAATPTASPSVPTQRVLPVLGPDGLRSLKLGMSLKQALATGLITPKSTLAFHGCTADYHLRGHASTVVWFSEKLGLVAINAYDTLGNTEGIHIGSSLTAVRRAYPGVLATQQAVEDSPGHAKVPGNPKANYRIGVIGNKVDELTLQLNDQDCYE